MMRTVYEKDPRVSASAVERFFDSFEPETNEVHCLELFHHGARVLRLAVPPYDPTDKREIYSLSKTFTSTAIGILVTDGKLSEEDRIIDLFPDKLPATVSENLAAMRLRHVLSMNTGHVNDTLVPVLLADDAPRTFLAQPVDCVPGTHFVYNSGASILLACIVERISGESLLDFLNERLFAKLGITDVEWCRTADGTCQGGCGFHCSCDDIAKLGLLYYHRGVWNGERILSEAWVAHATSFVSENGQNGTGDWTAGYGYQIWMNRREGFRGDGACGQLMVLLPKHDLLVCVQAEVGNMQTEMDAIYELCEHLFDPEPERAVRLPRFAPRGGGLAQSDLLGNYRLAENAMGWTRLFLSYDTERDALRFAFSDGRRVQSLLFGDGHWEESAADCVRAQPKLFEPLCLDAEERIHTVGSGCAEEGKLHLFLRFRSCPHRVHLELAKTPEGFTLEVREKNNFAAGARTLCGTRI